MMQAFRESPGQSNDQFKNLEARLAIESQRCLLLEQQLQVLREDFVRSMARIRELEDRLDQLIRDKAAAKTPNLQLIGEIPGKLSKATKKKV